MNNDASQQIVHANEVLISRDGYPLDLSSRTWKLSKNVTVYLSWVECLERITLHSFLEVMSYYAVNYSADYVRNINDRIKNFFTSTDSDRITVEALISYRSSLSSKYEWYLGAIRGFLIQWDLMGFPGVGEDIVDLLNGWRLRGNEKGRAVMSFDPLDGPLTDIEFEAVISGMLDGYIDGRIELQDYVLICLLVFTGRRPIQIVSLKIKDLISREQNGKRIFFINIPRAKQRGIGFREALREVPIIEDLWRLLLLQKESVIQQVSEKVGYKVSQDVIEELPIFPDYQTFQNISSANLIAALMHDYHHAPSGRCNSVLKKCLKVVEIYSERTGERIQLTPYRFRYTLATNMGREGKGVQIIADALDHTVSTSAECYTKNLPDIVERIDKAVAMQLAPFAQAFQGKLVKSEKEALRGDDPSSRIRSTNGGANVGSCGSYGYCGALAPIACYTCVHFQPWLDGPHEQVLDELLQKRDQIYLETNDIKIAATNDRLILAVSDVVQRCADMKACSEVSNV